jgi:hypothetical protein
MTIEAWGPVVRRLGQRARGGGEGAGEREYQCVVVDRNCYWSASLFGRALLCGLQLL